MIQSPRTRLQFSSADRLIVAETKGDILRQHIDRWFDGYRSLLPEFQTATELPCEIKLITQPPRHAGFGSGTQLAFSVAVGLLRFFDLPIPQPNELAPMMGRGGRSAIGSHGFFQGGLLVDRGRTDVQPVAPLDFQTSFPDDWPIVLAILHRQAAVSGTDESIAFSTLPDATQRQTEGLIELVNRKLVPAVAMQDYAAFGESVYTLSRQSGLFFQTVQGGPYNGHEIERLVNVVRDFGVPAVGQSSWGPCVFAIAPEIETADCLRQHIEQQFGDRCDTQVVFADNSGTKTLRI